MNGLKEYQKQNLLKLHSGSKEGNWQLLKQICLDQGYDTKIIEVVKGKYEDVVEYALSLEEDIHSIQELKIKKITALSNKTLAELYKEKDLLQKKLKEIDYELQEGDVDHE